MEAWHFLKEDRKLRYGTRETVVPGKTLRMEREPVLCQRGYHFSRRALDALVYAPGPIVCRVEIGGAVIEDEDKGVATERTVLWMADATGTLHEFAVWCAEQALTKERGAGREPDERSWRALEVKRRWLDGRATNAELAAAWAAVWDVEDAEWAVADAAASAASWGALDAARVAAHAATHAAPRDEQNTYLEQILMALKP